MSKGKMKASNTTKTSAPLQASSELAKALDSPVKQREVLIGEPDDLEWRHWCSGEGGGDLNKPLRWWKISRAISSAASKLTSMSTHRITTFNILSWQRWLPTTLQYRVQPLQWSDSSAARDRTPVYTYRGHIPFTDRFLKNFGKFVNENYWDQRETSETVRHLEFLR